VTGDTESVTNCYPLAAGAATDLRWLRAGDTLAALYTDVYGREFTTVCNGNSNRIASGRDGRDWRVDTQEWIQRLRSNEAELHILSVRELRGKTRWELDILLNAVLARHGLIFSRQDLAEHFGKQSWYEPLTESQREVGKQLSEEEKYHVHLIREFQRLHNLS